MRYSIPPTNLLVYVNSPAASPAINSEGFQGRLALGAAITAHYAGCIAPQVLNGAMPEEPLRYWLPVRLLLLAPPLVGILCAIWLVRRAPDKAGWRIRAGLPLLFGCGSHRRLLPGYLRVGRLEELRIRSRRALRRAAGVD